MPTPTSPPRTNDGAGLCVVVVEDDPVLRHRFVARLQEGGFDVRAARDFAEATAILQQTTPHLVCVDVVLPRESGFDLCEWVRNNPRLDPTLLLVLLERREPQERALAEAVGANAWLPKPVSPARLYEEVTSLLEGRETERRLASDPPSSRSFREASRSSVTPPPPSVSASGPPPSSAAASAPEPRSTARAWSLTPEPPGVRAAARDDELDEPTPLSIRGDYSWVPPDSSHPPDAPRGRPGSARPRTDVVEGDVLVPRVPSAPKLPAFEDPDPPSSTSFRQWLPRRAELGAVGHEAIEAATLAEVVAVVPRGAPPPYDPRDAVAWLARSAVAEEMEAYGRLGIDPRGIHSIESWAVATLGERGVSHAPHRWNPAGGYKQLVVGVGAIVGETLIRMFDGRWEADPGAPEDPLRWRVVLGWRLVAWPVMQARLRVRDGVSRDLVAFLSRVERASRLVGQGPP